MTFDLTKRLLLKPQSLTKTFDCDLRPDSGWRVELAFLTREGFERMLKKHTRRVYLRDSNEHVQKLDKQAYYEELADKIILGWSGLTIGVLKTLVAFDTTGLQDDMEVEFTREVCVSILRHSVGFDVWVTDLASQPGRFQDASTTDEEKAVGNSSPSPSGS